MYITEFLSVKQKVTSYFENKMKKNLSIRAIFFDLLKRSRKNVLQHMWCVTKKPT